MYNRLLVPSTLKWTWQAKENYKTYTKIMFLEGDHLLSLGLLQEVYFIMRWEKKTTRSLKEGETRGMNLPPKVHTPVQASLKGEKE